jgi:hypothetical protein
MLKPSVGEPWPEVTEVTRKRASAESVRGVFWSVTSALLAALTGRVRQQRRPLDPRSHGLRNGVPERCWQVGKVGGT